MLAQISVGLGSNRFDAQHQCAGNIFERLMSREEVARHLGVSPSFISKLMALEGLPYVQIGRAVRFDLNEVKKWLSLRRRP
jgi:excisionase family DNA binding protein